MLSRRLSLRVLLFFRLPAKRSNLSDLGQAVVSVVFLILRSRSFKATGGRTSTFSAISPAHISVRAHPFIGLFTPGFASKSSYRLTKFYQKNK